ncbi:putative bifunctional diguanylate cyclase/phosphodiesterase [Aquabacterium sp. J223]|uniref:putative bifunctional diguanylate cyclase/phosphodiesterase n=1 Tax=Aquabacterium sp. J223 TaxID=2898431 RepID=UPI0021ADB9A6|nr:EAL domain-containing protein [Aquabacterium sp. J223]UUX96918.1 EAL domain-containing protein [Aquabacterium sp. J223]
MSDRASTASRTGLLPLLRRLDVRIFALSLGLLLLVQLAGFTAIRSSIEHNARRQIERELQTGEKVLRRLLLQNAEQLAAGARLLAADYGFRAAVGSGDQGTVLDALDNHGQRIGASAALFTDNRQRLVASTAAGEADLPTIVADNLRFQQIAGESAQAPVYVLDGQPFQLVSVPVRAPQVIGHVSMGFPISARLGQELEEMVGLKMELLSRERSARGLPWRPLPGAAATAAKVATAYREEDGWGRVVLAGEDYGARLMPLAMNAHEEVAVLLLRSVDAVVAPYRQLQWSLLAITLVGVGVFGAGSLFTARRITGPIKQLSASAERLGAGDYSTPVAVASQDEVRDLAHSFESMRQAMQQREAQIRRLAYWDPLTGLPNREQLRERMTQATRGGLPCAVLVLDLDRFKHVNDVLGQAFGDRLLREIAGRLAGSVLREHDMVARLSGDEFAVLLPQADGEAAMAVAQRLRQALERPLSLDDHTVDASAAVGIALYPTHAHEADLLLGHAEVAMYAAKDRRSGVTVYEPALDSASAESLSLLSELREAVAENQLRLYLQPKIALADGRVLGAEALVRWQHPKRGLVPPMQFIPFAEQTGFIRQLTGWMIERCAARAQALKNLDLPLKFSVNLSTRDLLDQDLPAKLERLLVERKMSSTLVCLEITESAIMDDPERALQTLARLHAMGLKLSIDDFGTGYSSLAYLKRLPLHELKIDRSFVMAMTRDPADRKIVRSTIDLAHNLGLSVVAEGVEDRATWDLLHELGCDEGQGYHIARPMPEEEFAGWLMAWSARQADPVTA